MAKRKITVTVDEALVDSVRLGDESLSSIVNSALVNEVARRDREMALTDLLAEWDDTLGPIDDDSVREAEQAFDALDARVPVRFQATTELDSGAA